jgi:hypothetical protein
MHNLKRSFISGAYSKRANLEAALGFISLRLTATNDHQPRPISPALLNQDWPAPAKLPAWQKQLGHYNVISSQPRTIKLNRS